MTKTFENFSQVKDRYIVVKMEFGSHLYGTDTAESDRDYKGIYLPTLRELLLGCSPKHIQEFGTSDKEKNTKFDIDSEFYSLSYFVDMGRVGDTAVLDMLHCPPKNIIVTSPIWELIVAHRDKFYTRSLKSLIGYARRQAAKYGIKGSRLSDIEAVLVVLRKADPTHRLRSVWPQLPSGEHIHILPSGDDRFQMYQIAGRKFIETMKVSGILECLEKVYKEYGTRALQAKQNEGVDWKALSHAIRAAYEVIEIFEHGTIMFPLIESYYIKQVKSGTLDYTTEVAPRLESLLETCERLAKVSKLPQMVDKVFWDDLVYSILMEHVVKPNI